MNKQLLALVRKSIDDGYLPEDWHRYKEDVVSTATKYLALTRDCIMAEDEFYHEANDDDNYTFDDAQSKYILSENAIEVYIGRNDTFFTHIDNQNDYSIYQGNYYEEMGCAHMGWLKCHVAP